VVEQSSAEIISTKKNHQEVQLTWHINSLYSSCLDLFFNILERPRILAIGSPNDGKIRVNFITALISSYQRYKNRIEKEKVRLSDVKRLLGF
jgi:hypothetical protein